MIETIILITVFAYLVLASVNDIKHRFVHDYTSYSFGLLFLILRFLLYFETGDFNSLLTVFYFAVPTFIISYVLYKIGAWGGGDVKLLTSLSIGIPFLSTDNSVIPFFANFLSNTLIAGLLFGVLWTLILIFKNLKKASKALSKLDYLILIVFSTLSIIFFFRKGFYKIFSIILVFLPLSFIAKKLEDTIQVIDKKVRNLEPGDWILKDIKIGGKTVKKTPIGLTKKDIKVLQKSKLRKIKIRDGIPFVPSFLLAFLVTLFYDNIIINFVAGIITSM